MPPKKGAKRKTKNLDPVRIKQDEKAEVLISELDNLREEQERKLLHYLETEIQKTNAYYKLLDEQLPALVKNMTIKDIREKNFDFQATNATQKAKVDNSAALSKFLEKKKPQVKPTPKETLPASKRKKSLGKRRSLMTKKVRPASTRGSRILPSQARSSKKSTQPSADDSYVDISEDEVFFTPTHKPIYAGSVITPKVDPGKPILRSLIRRALPGELSWSQSGSPILHEPQDNRKMLSRTQSEILTTVKCGKKEYTFSESQGPADHKERRVMTELMKKLSVMINK